MKHIQILIITAFLIITACGKSDTAYKDFAPGGEIMYPGKVDSVKLYPGNNRIKLTWLLKMDSRITKCRVYWNQRQDSAEVAVTRTSGVDTISVLLNNITEGAYSFDVYSYNAQGNVSIKTNATGDVYGDFYKSNLVNRLFKKAVYSAGKTRIEWVVADPRTFGLQLRYKDLAGVTQTLLVPSSELITNIPANVLNNELEYQTLYLPVPNAIDIFMATTVKVIAKPE
ncbi:hypothetical protein GFS24_01910 [Chitinophaga sp. SYP-B3965]|uniref:DUF4998 domain-containing protein n=1 Tax=Chitinophaga sp. SYP-B3965 TaxID=2663120 RepID=UPI0012997491|nr:DUF4998 domain-containing protein [Chitinophaga sp. SYP-B3965]MRG43846.1 hypothetical protein [Chitinophaga sp. SYP-B3965]